MRSPPRFFQGIRKTVLPVVCVGTQSVVAGGAPARNAALPVRDALVAYLVRMDVRAVSRIRARPRKCTTSLHEDKLQVAGWEARPVFRHPADPAVGLGSLCRWGRSWSRWQGSPGVRNRRSRRRRRCPELPLAIGGGEEIKASRQANFRGCMGRSNLCLAPLFVLTMSRRR